MKMFVILAFATLVFTACHARNDGSMFIGKWAAPTKNFAETPYVSCQCPIEITKIGDTFHVSVDPNDCGDVCKGYEGPYTLSADGTLKSSNQFTSVVILFDKSKSQVAMSSAHSGLQYLSRPMDADLAAKPGRFHHRLYFRRADSMPCRAPRLRLGPRNRKIMGDGRSALQRRAGLTRSSRRSA